MIDVGASVPDLPLALSSETSACLKDYASHWLVLYFYPKDSTPGCTTEGIEFNVLLHQFQRRKAVVLGVSRDSLKSHQNFCAKQGFRFDLVSDTNAVLCQAFGVIKLKNMYGKQVLGIERSTFLIAPDGTLARAWRGVKVPGHAQAVLDAIPAK
jgi:peroxiredoxin Q/BCP